MIPAAEVLLIEHEEVDRQLLLELVALKGRGRVRITEAANLATGMERLRSHHFDLILLDTKLRDASALSALRAVGEVAPETPILSHSIFVTVPTRDAVRRRGPWDIVIRGELDSLWAEISHQLARAPAETGVDTGLPPT
jgi:DNA-binding NarL/FixJ family response regulator